MNSGGPEPQGAQSVDELAVEALYRRLLDSWNKRSAGEFAALFVEDGHVVGFDGSQMDSRAEIGSALGQVFSDHVTATYVAKVRDVTFLAPHVAVLRAVVGMIPPGQSDLNPGVNAIQSLVACRPNGQWLIAFFQNTPAQFHGRPDLAQKLTEELRQLL